MVSVPSSRPGAGVGGTSASDASAMLMMGVAEVPVAIALGAVVLGERLPPGTLVGGLCVLAAIMAGLTGSSNPRRVEPSLIPNP
jgi:drug/metabolite transporter (DMT)-like permease